MYNIINSQPLPKRPTSKQAGSRITFYAFTTKCFEYNPKWQAANYAYPQNHYSRRENREFSFVEFAVKRWNSRKVRVKNPDLYFQPDPRLRNVVRRLESFA